MSIAECTGDSKAAIWDRALRINSRDLSEDLAKFLVDLQLDSDDLARMSDLTKRNQAGELSRAELAELDNYYDVALFMEILAAKARRTMGNPRPSLANGVQ